jgi:hypothetical protein
VHLATVLDGEGKLLTYDGSSGKVEKFELGPQAERSGSGVDRAS